ncbi:MAG: SH3 domain-containing protein [Syntrophomonadaceae bacterium]|nr:SH3 domain-containing protein [Syntrophomonadaceae bacterium]
MGTINDNGVNVRSGPGTNYSILKTLTKGTGVTILETKGDWQQIQYGSLKGWVTTRFISTGSQPTSSGKYQLQVTATVVNLRSGPDTGYSKVGQVRKGDILTVVDIKGNWYRIKTASGLDAYILSDYVKKYGEASPDAPVGNTVVSASAPYVTVISGPANVRVSPDSSSTKLTILNQGAVCPNLGQQGDWCKIRLSSGKTGYIASRLVQENKANADSSSPAAVKPVGDPKDAEDTQSTAKGAEEAYVNDTKIPAGVIKLSRTRDENGIKIFMRSGSVLKGEIDSDDDKVVYDFADHHIEGLNYFEELLGKGSVKVRATSKDDVARIEMEFPDTTVSKTSSEDGGKTEVLTILNSIQGVEQREFGDTGDRVVITTATPVKYVHRRQDDNIILELKNIEQGSARNEYEFDDCLVQMVQLQKSSAGSGVTITIKVPGLGKYTTGLTNNGTALNIMLVGKNDIKARNNNLVVLDPGHGGKDPGARGGQINEKDVNLDIALKVGDLLKQKGIQVEYTRTSDSYLDLEPRAAMANRLNAGMFVSIHNNANADNTKQGTETYYYAPMEVPDLFMIQDERRNLAGIVHKSLANKIQRPNRGVKTANFSVLRNTRMPSILIETVFVSNPDEQQLLMSDVFRNQAAQGIAEGIIDYIKK